MTNGSNRLNNLSMLLPACVIAATGTHALAQSNCVNGPPASVAAAAPTLTANLTDLSISACAISTMPATCANPGNQDHRIFWNPVLLAAGGLADELVVI